MKKHVLVLHENTFLWIKGGEGYVYDSLSFAGFRFQNEGLLEEMVTDLLQIDNLYRVILTDEQLKDEKINKWISQLLSIKCADFIIVDDENYPISFKPELKIKDDIDYYRAPFLQAVDVNIMQNLHKLVIHVNSSKYGNNKLAQQLNFPIKGEVELDKEVIYKLVVSAGTPNFLAEISLIGNIWEHSECNALLNSLRELKLWVSAYCTDCDCKDKDLVNIMEIWKNLLLHILITDYTNVDEVLDKYSKCSERIYFDFIISSKSDYEKAELLCEKYELERSQLLPIYTGDNLSFFEDNIYLTTEDIQSITLSKREVFAHQAINTHTFGTLTVFPDGNVYSDVNDVPLGKIEEGLYPIVCREILEGHSWFAVRNQSPCCDCVYQYLCPSPSSYEAVIGKANLCHIK